MLPFWEFQELSKGRWRLREHIAQPSVIYDPFKSHHLSKARAEYAVGCVNAAAHIVDENVALRQALLILLSDPKSPEGIANARRLLHQ